MTTSRLQKISLMVVVLLGSACGGSTSDPTPPAAPVIS